jgi:hypothetical protein
VRHEVHGDGTVTSFLMTLMWVRFDSGKSIVFLAAAHPLEVIDQA